MLFMIFPTAKTFIYLNLFLSTMKKKGGGLSTPVIILIIIAGMFFLGFFAIIFAVAFSSTGTPFGNVALILIEGPITGNGGSYLGQGTASSKMISKFIEDADENPLVEVILLEINSPGGSAVASDEIAIAVKATEKPVVAFIREVGASGGYWIASSTDYIITNRMAITGSIGVISSYLEFSELFDKYGIGYEQLIAGKNKDLGTPFRKLEENERKIIQKKLNLIHDYFIEEVATNRDLSEQKVRKLATGEFYLGVEALNLGLVDQLGSKNDVENHLKETYGLENIDYIVYEPSVSFFDLLQSVFSNFFFKIGEGFGSMLLQKEDTLLLM